MKRWRRAAWRVACLTLMLNACREGQAPPPRQHTRRLLVPGTEIAAALVVDLDRRMIVRTMGPQFVTPGPSVFTDEGLLIAAGRLGSNELILVALDTRSGSELWRVTIAQGTQPVLIDGIALGATLMAKHPTRPELYLWRSTRDGQPGVAVYDYESRRVTGFLGPIPTQPAALTVAAAAAGSTEGCLIIGANAGAGQNVRTVLYVLCGRPFAERDSIAFASPSVVTDQLVTVFGGSEVLLGTNAELVKVNVATRSVLSRVARPHSGPIIVSASDGRLFLPDAGSPSLSSQGLILVLTRALELSAIIDLHALPVAKRPLAIQGAAVSLDGRWLYLIGGVPRTGPLYGPQAAHVLVIDTRTGAVTDIVPLGTLGGASPSLIP